jgi:hypothetical protein
MISGKEGCGMKRLAVVLLAVVLGIALLCLGATQKLVNQTGAPASGVTLTFSEAVRITSYDKSIFPNQSPALGESESFTFSGGSVPAGGTFQVSWSPNAKLRSTKWITSGSPAVGSTASIPTTYEEIMAQIAHYPGPDESLYVPAEGEAIWLTGLEGHADIYDNDSIKINYAPWFDKSQITKVEVYRNGIKMRFLPDKLDVLTNEQMKTFDGNPLERTPKSYHIDHAIMGYEYKVVVVTAQSSTPLLARVKSGFTYGGSILAQLDRNWFSDLGRMTPESVRDFLRTLRDDGFDGVGIEYITYLSSPTSSEPFALRQVDLSVDENWTRTATPEEFASLLAAIREVGGLSITVRGNFLIGLAYRRANGFACNSHVNPSNPSAFFDNYAKLWLEVIPTLEKYGVEEIDPFTEADGIERWYPDRVKALYTKLSQSFSGEIGFEESVHNYTNGTSAFQRGSSFASNAGRFWDWRDKEGRLMPVLWSTWSAPLDSQRDQRYSPMAANWLRFFTPARNYYAENYPDNPLEIGEFGSFPVDGFCLGKDYYKLKDKQWDEQEYSDCLAGILLALTQMNLYKAALWVIPLYPWKNEDPARDCFIPIDSVQYRLVASILTGR